MLFQEEAALINKIRKKNDKVAADQLIRKYYQDIYGYVYRQTSNKEISMDLTQEIFISVLQSIHYYESSKGAFRSWLYRIATNKIVDYYRSRSYKERTLTVNLEDMEVSSEEDVFMIISRQELVEKVSGIVGGFDIISSRIFRLKFFGEYTFLQIAEMLRMNESTVKTKYYTMLRKIRRELEADEYTEY